ncbi:MAG: hypothetical protein K1X53_07225 [Candidatus Sumerlaeaceae bacterium]|nr:hypothetical protein [Candidatus Sumerlaeaceae bacterium]
MEQDTAIHDSDWARAEGMDVWKFKYSLKPGNYDTDVWLEQWDKDSTAPRRLTFGKTSSKKVIDGGNLIVSVMDPATTQDERNKTWRVTMSRHEDSKKLAWSKSSDLITDPFALIVGARTMAAIDQEKVKLNKEITLVTWAGGNPCTTSDHATNIRLNARTVYLKMRVMPEGELMKAEQSSQQGKLRQWDAYWE